LTGSTESRSRRANEQAGMQETHPPRATPNLDAQERGAAVKSLSCVFVGVLNRGAHIIRLFANDPRFRAAALVDKERSIAEAKARELGWNDVYCSDDLSETLARVEADACVITSPARFHGTQIRAALEAGCHVFVAKPMTYDLDEAHDLVRLAESKGLGLIVDHQQRHLETEQALKRFVREGTFGRLGHVSFTIHRYRPVMAAFTGDNPFIWEQGVHSFDSLVSILGRPARSVLAVQDAPCWTAYNGPTTAMGVVEFEGGVYCNYLGTFESRNHVMEIRLDFERAAVRAVAENNWQKTLEVAAPGADFRPYGIADGASGIPAERPNIDALFQAATRGGRVENDGRENLQVLAIVDAFIRSSKSGRKEPVRQFPQ